MAISELPECLKNYQMQKHYLIPYLDEGLQYLSSRFADWGQEKVHQNGPKLQNALEKKGWLKGPQIKAITENVSKVFSYAQPWIQNEVVEAGRSLVSKTPGLSSIGACLLTSVAFQSWTAGALLLAGSISLNYYGSPSSQSGDDQEMIKIANAISDLAERSFPQNKGTMNPMTYATSLSTLTDRIRQTLKNPHQVSRPGSSKLERAAISTFQLAARWGFRYHFAFTLLPMGIQMTSWTGWASYLMYAGAGGYAGYKIYKWSLPEKTSTSKKLSEEGAELQDGLLKGGTKVPERGKAPSKKCYSGIRNLCGRVCSFQLPDPLAEFRKRENYQAERAGVIAGTLTTLGISLIAHYPQLLGVSSIPNFFIPSFSTVISTTAILGIYTFHLREGTYLSRSAKARVVKLAQPIFNGHGYDPSSFKGFEAALNGLQEEAILTPKTVRLEEPEKPEHKGKTPEHPARLRKTLMVSPFPTQVVKVASQPGREIPLRASLVQSPNTPSGNGEDTNPLLQSYYNERIALQQSYDLSEDPGEKATLKKQLAEKDKQIEEERSNPDLFLDSSNPHLTEQAQRIAFSPSQLTPKKPERKMRLPQQPIPSPAGLAPSVSVSALAPPEEFPFPSKRYSQLKSASIGHPGKWDGHLEAEKQRILTALKEVADVQRLSPEFETPEIEKLRASLAADSEEGEAAKEALQLEHDSAIGNRIQEISNFLASQEID